MSIPVLSAIPLCLLAVANNTIAAKEKTEKTPNPPAKQCRLSGSYCGIYCLYAVMKLFDIYVDPKELLKPEYIGSHKGSSLAELKKAAEDNGLYAVPVGKLTSRELRQSPYPIILHVKSAKTSKEYNHYELFLDTKDGQARLYDPPEPVKLVPFYELAPRWDGTGLIVSDRPIDLGPIFAPAQKRFIIYAAIAIAAILMVYWGRRRWWLDPSRGFALLGYEHINIRRDGSEWLISRMKVNKLKEVAPRIWWPMEASAESGPSRPGKPYSRTVYRASNVIANDPNFDESIFTAPFPDDYLIDDKVAGRKYRVGEDPNIPKK